MGVLIAMMMAIINKMVIVLDPFTLISFICLTPEFFDFAATKAVAVTLVFTVSCDRPVMQSEKTFYALNVIFNHH